jgi:hypothetical protein
MSDPQTIRSLESWALSVRASNRDGYLRAFRIECARERAAILEHDAGIPRADAERIAAMAWAVELDELKEPS